MTAFKELFLKIFIIKTILAFVMVISGASIVFASSYRACKLFSSVVSENRQKTSIATYGSDNFSIAKTIRSFIDEISSQMFQGKQC